MYETGKHALTAYLEQLDYVFKHKPNRSSRYHIKKYETRYLVTIFGTVTFKRTVYLDCHTGQYYTPVDRQLGLVKNNIYDPFINALILEHASKK